MIAIIPKELKSDLLLRMGGGECDGHTTQSGRQFCGTAYLPSILG